MSVPIRFVTRKACALCDDAERRLVRVAGAVGVTVERVDVDADPAMAARYGEQVPVVLVGDREVGAGPIGTSRLLAAVLRARLTPRGRG